MIVHPSVRTRCQDCQIVVRWSRTKGHRVRVICKRNPRHKQVQG